MSISPSDAVDADEIGETGESVAADHADAEGAPDETSIGSRNSWREMLMSTDPEKPLGATESPWDPNRGGPTRIYRAFQKMADFDGMPAAGDLVIGVIETVVAFEPDGGEETSESDSSEQRDTTEQTINDPAEGLQ